MKAHPGATTDDIIDHIKPTFRQKTDIVITHSGTHDLIKDANAMSRVRKVGVAVKETDTERKIKLGFSDVAARSDINKEEVIINSKVRLSLSKKKCFICFDESPLNMMKNAFYFTIKFLFALKIFKFLS